MEPHDYYGSDGYERMQSSGWRESAALNSLLLTVGWKMLLSGSGVYDWLGLFMIGLGSVRVSGDVVSMLDYKKRKER